MNRSRTAAFLPAMARSVVPAALASILSLIAFAGCSERDLSTLSPMPGNTDPVVFDDDFGEGVDYQGFAGSNISEGILAVDTSQKYQGTASLRIAVPGSDDEAGVWVGGAFTAADFRDLSGYDALTFWARSSVPSTLNVAGFGNDNTGNSMYEASRSDIPLTTQWTRVVIPIPLPARLSRERGLFYLAEAFEGDDPFQLWLDEIRFERLGTLADRSPRMNSKAINGFVGAAAVMDTSYGIRTAFRVGSDNLVVRHMPGYFAFSSTDPGVAFVQRGAIELVGGGSATISARLDTLAVTGAVTVSVLAPPAAPAPVPTPPTSDVVSLFSDVYPAHPIDTWNPRWQWSTAEVEDFQIAGDNVKLITGLNFLGVVFTSQPVDASQMTHFHLDVWAPAGTNFKVKLVAFSATGQFVGEAELVFDAGSTPAFVSGDWSSLEVPLSDFQLAAPRDHLGQMVLSTDDARTVFVDNVYFHK